MAAHNALVIHSMQSQNHTQSTRMRHTTNPPLPRLCRAGKQFVLAAQQAKGLVQEATPTGCRAPLLLLLTPDRATAVRLPLPPPRVIALVTAPCKSP